MTNETTTRNFDKEYAHEGGVAKLRELYEAGTSTSDIAEVFGISTKQVNYYLKRIMGDNYYRYPFRRIAHDMGLRLPHERGEK